ncbi:MAG: M48 family metallopeptidase [Pseudomonadales bacterium]|nr:M48 family metallopeptidase [Pseudomonadales bacterium]
MTFYEHQHRARRKTGLLFSYFIIAVILIVVSVNAVVFLTLFMSDANNAITPAMWIRSPLCWGIAAITLSVIVGGSVYRHGQIRGGGDSIAIMAGGRLVLPETTDPLEKRLLNIAEEMAIASGTHIPRVYLLEDEPGINAFVAGYNANNTILAVTKGALETLTRDELQGVIGHEYSHVLNSDTRINLNLISILAGILLIGQIGESLMRSASYSRLASRRNNNSGGQFAIGIAFMAIGYIGLFFGRLIKAAISRQREFLADASAVQFTRNPFGIGGALYKIGASQSGSLLTSKHAEDMSHMCFGETLKVSLSGMLATHPPIEHRLKAIDPSLPTRMKSRFNQGDLTLADGTTAFTGQPLMTATVTASGVSQASGFSATASAAPSHEANILKVDVENNNAEPVANESFAINSQTLKKSVGTLTPTHVQEAHDLFEQIPVSLLDIAHQSKVAASVIYGLILTTMSTHGKPAIKLVKEHQGENVADRTVAVYQTLRKTTPAIRLPLLEVAIASLETIEEEKRIEVLWLTHELIQLDNKFMLYEFIYLSLVEKYLAPRNTTDQPKRQIKSYEKVENAIAVLMAAIVLASEAQPEAQQTIFTQAMSGFSKNNFNQLLVRPPGIETLSDALKLLARLSPLLKQPLVDACVDSILHDEQITPNEANLLRAICERLDCPMPIIAQAAK